MDPRVTLARSPELYSPRAIDWFIFECGMEVILDLARDAFWR